MEQKVLEIVANALNSLKKDGLVPEDFQGPVIIERPKRPEFGDFGCALPLVLARVMKRSPAECAGLLIKAMTPPAGLFESIEFAPPGYVNFRVTVDAWFKALKTVLDIPQIGNREKVLLEFVSTNPTGPLHVGHGRGAVLGDAIARLMRATGFDVETEYLINDVGNQMAMLGRSIHARGQEYLGIPSKFPENGYHGEYIRTLAQSFAESDEGKAICKRDYDDISPSDNNAVVRYGASTLLEEIQETLADLDIHFDHWFSERTLHQSGRVQASVDALLAKGAAYRDETGAVLFKMDLDDEDDRVIVRSNQLPTYFASDIAYHDEKAKRGYKRLINIWGADHHGYIPRVKAALEAFDHDPELLHVVLVQMVALIRGKEIVPMGKRTGKFVTLQEIVDEVGSDAVRFIFLLRRADAQMEFDLDLARSQTMDNPVYYVQYGHARVASIIRKAAEMGISVPVPSPEMAHVLNLPEEQSIIRGLNRYPSVIAISAMQAEPHHVAFYLMEIVKEFHSYYTRYKGSEKVISDDAVKTAARLYLVSRIQAVLGHGLGLLGVSAPESMYYGAEDDEA
jgi:arginyl-tRNA synthetase